MVSSSLPSVPVSICCSATHLPRAHTFSVRLAVGDVGDREAPFSSTAEKYGRADDDDADHDVRVLAVADDEVAERVEALAAGLRRAAASRAA